MSNNANLHQQIDRLTKIMRDLRDPQTGCPWDIEQDFASIAPYTIEEAYEVSEAIYSGDRDKLADELGDLLLQVVFHAQMAHEEGSFDLSDVARLISDKMIRRHPHVFGESARGTAQTTKQAWEDIKAEERKHTRHKDETAVSSILDDVAITLPAIVRASKLQKRAARVGFDWPDLKSVIAKMHEETAELLEAFEEEPNNQERLQDEVGDILFVAANLARKTGIDPESALLACNRKFEKRFKFIEQQLSSSHRSVEDASLDEMEALWQDAKEIKLD